MAIFSIFILVLVILLVAVIVILIHARARISPTTSTLKSRFNDTSTEPKKLGGLLISTFSNQDAAKMVAKNSVEYADFTQCAAVHRKTCGAWSYLRKDVWSTAFMNPGMFMGIGIIVDPREIWPLLTTMAVVDADTNLRSACSNESGGNITLSSARSDDCLSQVFFKQHPSIDDYTLELSADNAGSSAPTTCAESDEACQIVNSGGTINVYDLIQFKPCSTFEPCFNFTPAKNNTYLEVTNDCSACKKPYLCSAQSAPAGIDRVEEKDQITAYVGQRSSNWRKLFTDPTYPSVGFTAVTQCKYKKKDWKEWINALHSYYQYLLTFLKPDNSSAFPELMASPQNPIYLENEVNSYVYPQRESTEYKRQEKIFQKSIFGFFYINTTCEEQLAPLKDHIDTAVICDTFYETYETANRIVAEKSLIDTSRANAHKLAKLAGVPVYKANLDSNAFPYYEHLQRALAGTLDFDTMFEEDMRVSS